VVKNNNNKMVCYELCNSVHVAEEKQKYNGVSYQILHPLIYWMDRSIIQNSFHVVGDFQRQICMQYELQSHFFLYLNVEDYIQIHYNYSAIHNSQVITLLGWTHWCENLGDRLRQNISLKKIASYSLRVYYMI